jgi:4-amino-4-deoxy-L-arabinose transferase-like glycosyltransferase
MNIRVTSRFAIFVALLLISIIGVLLVLQATPEGAGLSDDSIAYIAGARSMVAGHGYREAWLASNQPVTHFPPAFPSLLAFFGLFGLDPLHAARWVNALLFGANAGLLGVLAWRMTPSLTAGLVLAGLFILSSDLLQVHAVAMSEPLFIFLSLLSFWMFDLYFERDQHWWLGACATFVGMAYLTRYSGLALIATFVVALFVLHKSWKQKLVHSALFVAGTLPWILGWTFRNKLIAENATNRTFAWHPITRDNLHIGLRTLAEALSPVDAWRKGLIRQPLIVEVLIVLLLGAVLVWLALRTWKYISQPTALISSPAIKGDPRAKEVISFTTGLYLFAYLAAIISSMLMFDAATKFKLRILAPMFVSVLILLIYFGVWLRDKNRPLIVVMTFVLLTFSAYKQIQTVGDWSRGGEGYASFKWYDSKAMVYLSNLPADVHIYTDEPAAVYLYTGRGNYVLPDRFDSATALPREGFDESLEQMRQEILDGKAVLAIFSGGEVTNEEEALFSEGLYLAHKSAGDAIYAAQP